MNGSQQHPELQRSNSTSHNSETSQTAQDYIATQLRLEADAREALPYQFDTCTKPLGPLRQSVFACLTCTPPPASPHQVFSPAGVCYSCSISCHGEHELVELFTKRDFVCDCGTTRFANSATPCNLRPNPQTNLKGGVTGEAPRHGNKYNHNFQGRFCACGDEYDPHKEKGTMFQCLGLGTIQDGGCGEDWWHPECLLGLPREATQQKQETAIDGGLETIKEQDEDAKATVPRADNEQQASAESEDPALPVDGEPPLPPGFPAEDDFDHLICYKCVEAFPWINSYAGTPGFLSAVPLADATTEDLGKLETPYAAPASLKRKAEEDEDLQSQESKRTKSKVDIPGDTTGVDAGVTTATDPTAAATPTQPKHARLPSAPAGRVSLFLKEDFRDHLCRCSSCFPRLSAHPQLLEPEDSYEPPVSEGSSADEAAATGSMHSGSLLSRGEAALSSMDRVRAIEGVMAYNHVRDKVKAFLQPFAESGTPVGAEDIKAYFAKLRGDETTQKDASAEVAGQTNGSDHRKEQGGY